MNNREKFVCGLNRHVFREMTSGKLFTLELLKNIYETYVYVDRSNDELLSLTFGVSIIDPMSHFKT